MKKKHYELIAGILERERYAGGHELTIWQIAHSFAVHFSAIDKNFSREKFYKACGIQE